MTDRSYQRSVAVTVALVFVLLAPGAHPVTASTQPLAVRTAGAAAAAPDVPPAARHALHADTAALHRLVWTAGTLERLLAERDYATALLLGLAARDWPAGVNAAADITTLVERMRLRAGEFDQCRQAVDAAQGTLCALERVHGLAPPAMVPALADEAARLVGQVLRAPAPVNVLAAGFGVPRQDALQRYVEGRLEALWPASLPALSAALAAGAAPDLPGAALALEPWLRERIGFSLGDRAETVLAGSPALTALLSAYPVLGEVRAGRIQPATVASALGNYNSFFGSLVDSAHVAVRRLGAAADGVAGAAAQPGDIGAWAARRSFVYLASRFAGADGSTPGDPGIVSSLAALGNAAVDLNRGLGDLPGGLLSAGRGVAAFALTGNLIGIASGMTALLNVAGVTHNNAPAEVRALRGVVDSLRVEVDGRFDHLDAAVDGVLASLSDGFERLERATAASGEASRREIAAVHAEVNALGQRFDRMDDTFRQYMEAGFDRDYARTLARCLEHRERFAPPNDRMEFAAFSSCIVDFRTRAVSDARDALLADRTTTTDDAAILTALADAGAQNYARRLPLLARVATQRYGHDASARGPLANPLEWSLAAEAYLRMLDEWPEHAMSVTPADLDAIIATGTELDAWAQRLTTGAPGQARPDLLLAVLADYSRAAAQLRGAVENLAGRQQQTRMQRIPRDSLARQVTPRDGQGPALPMPRALIDRIPGDALAAAMLGLQPLEFHYDVTLQDSVVRDNFSSRFLRGTRHERHHWARPVVTIEARLGGSPVALFELQGQPVLQRTDIMDGGAESERVRGTTVHVADVPARFLAEEWSRVVRDGNWRSLPGAGVDQRALGTSVQSELERYAAQSLDSLFGEVCTADTAPGARADLAALRAPLQAMSAARALLTALIRAGLSRTVAVDPDMAELLHGAARLPDQASLCARLRAGDGMLRLLWLEDEPGRAASHATVLLTARLADSATLPEPLDLVAPTLERLNAARRIQQVRAAARP